MKLNVLEGFIELEGEHPILITALHGFGADSYKDIVKILRRCVKASMYIKTFGFDEEFRRLIRYSSSVDLYTWEIAFKVAVSEKLWALLPTLSKVDKIDALSIPDYNLNKGYSRITPFWMRSQELVDSGKVKVLIDIHGMKNVRGWPDICISTRRFTSASKELINIVSTTFRTYGLKVSVDYPFIGGAFIAHFGKPPKTEAFAIEVKRNLRFYGSKIPEILREAVRVIKIYLHRSDKND